MTTHGTARNLVRLPALSLAASIMAAAGCTNADDNTSGETPEAVSPTTSVSAALDPEQIDDPEQAAIAAYTRYWDTVEASFATPDGDFADLEAIAAEQALEYAKSIEQRAIDENVHGTGEAAHDIAIKETSLTGEVQQIVVIDCVDTTNWQVLDAEDNPVPGEEYGTKEIQGRIELLDEHWIVTVMAVQEIGTCVPD
ncbi:hypothetical protein GCM10029992_36190 [Glycomyces albus]